MWAGVIGCRPRSRYFVYEQNQICLAPFLRSGAAELNENDDKTELNEHGAEQNASMLCEVNNKNGAI